MHAQSVVEPTWSGHKIDLGAKDAEIDIPKLLTNDYSPKVNGMN